MSNNINRNPIYLDILNLEIIFTKYLMYTIHERTCKITGIATHNPD